MRTSNPPHLVLASASPARLKTLRAAGIEPQVLISGIDESSVEHTRADEVSLTLARLKARAVSDRISSVRYCTEGDPTGGSDPDQPGVLVLGCDSVLEFDGQILGKPADEPEAVHRWLAMRGRSGVLHTGHCLIDVTGGREVAEVASTVVHFAAVTDEEITAYVATGEPLHVAGAFTIDGLGGPFIERVEGDPGTVVGLSLPLLRTLLSKFDLSIVDLWTTATR